MILLELDYLRTRLRTRKSICVTELRRGSRTVEDLRSVLGITDNAVRAHLSSLERDGIVHQTSTRPSGRRPAIVYELTEDAERSFSHAYMPVLTRLVDTLSERMTAGELAILLRNVGDKLAVEESNGAIAIRGYSCPLAEAVRAHPATCQAARALVSELVGVEVKEVCDRSERPRCRFELRNPSAVRLEKPRSRS